LFKATTGTDFGELNVFGSGSSTSIGLGNSGGTLFAGFNFATPVSTLLASGSADFDGGIVSVPGERGLASLAGTAVLTPLPAALPLFATGIGGLGLLGWRRKRKAQAVVRSNG
jgi:hypothetical protein